jgi:dinuclear metal center YbgI/SA1388 family protein
MRRQELVDYLAHLLEVDKFRDYCVNGLQVEGREEIHRIVTGVSASRRLFAEAIKRKADAVIVHHGLFWKSDPDPFYLAGLQAARVRDLLINDISLLGYHLPLDSHPTLGNNAQIAKRLGMEVEKRVDVNDWPNAGYVCKLPEPVRRDVFVEKVDGKLDAEARVFPYGLDKVERVMVISGGSSDFYRLALGNQCDTFLGGDIREGVVRLLEEGQLNFVAAGHYNTEKWGIIALGNHLVEKLKLEVQWVDVPNPV